MSDKPGFKTYYFVSQEGEVHVEVKNCIDEETALGRLEMMQHVADNMGIKIFAEFDLSEVE